MFSVSYLQTSNCVSKELFLLFHYTRNWGKTTFFWLLSQQRQYEKVHLKSPSSGRAEELFGGQAIGRDKISLQKSDQTEFCCWKVNEIPLFFLQPGE